MNTLQTNIGTPQTISSKPDHYHGWPTVIGRSNGELIAGFSGGRVGHVCPFGQVQMIRSKDEGETWSDHQILVDGPLDDRDTGLLETAQGTLIATWFTSLAWESKLRDFESQGSYHRRAGERIGLNEKTITTWQKLREDLDDKKIGRAHV